MACVFEPFLLGGVLAAILLALNWRALSRPKLAWFTGLLIPAALIIIPFAFEEVTIAGVAIATFGVFTVGLALPQLFFMRKTGIVSYKKRRWIIPIGIGILIQVVWPYLESIDVMTASANVPESLVTSTPPTAQPLTVEEVVKINSPKVLQLEVTWEMDEPYLLFFSETRKAEASGSAFAYMSVPGAILLVTNRHVVEVPKGAKNVVRSLITGEEKAVVDVMAYAQNGIDLALLQLRADDLQETYRDQHVQMLHDITVGQECVAIGNAFGAGISISTGVVSRVDDFAKNRVIRTTAPISPGNSGGALFNAKTGALMGITTGSIQSEGAQNINFAIPVDYFSEKSCWDWSTLPQP